ncbi:hypothetical protein GH733_002177 [Mirounga leonina]|nr:hypothetical protein GH733_002177 [Mirounga leonina]
MGSEMEPLLLAWSYFRRRKFQLCADLCTQMLEKSPYDQVPAGPRQPCGSQREAEDTGGAGWGLQGGRPRAKLTVWSAQASGTRPPRAVAGSSLSAASPSPRGTLECCVLAAPSSDFSSPFPLRARALTEMVYVDEIDVDQEGIAEMMLDENAIAQVPLTQAGRPITGFLRPGTQSGRPGTMEQAIRTPRTAYTARPITSSSGRFVRLGTASMLTSPDGPFINLSRLNLTKYAQKPKLAKALFEYIFHHENDVKTKILIQNELFSKALDLAALSTEHSQYKDWWWKVQIGKCYYRLGMYREAEKQFKSALKQQEMVDTFLYLAKVYISLDQPVTALNLFKQGLDKFPGEVTLLFVGRNRGVAFALALVFLLACIVAADPLHASKITPEMRQQPIPATPWLHHCLSYWGSEMNNISSAAEYYREVLKQDNTHVEAIACIGSNHFYSDQPEIALRFYRRLLQMGVYNCQLFNNLGLCCFYAQQYDMTLTSFERALALAENEEEAADVWYNLGHVAVGIGDMNLAHQCFRLTLVNNNHHAEAYNNLAARALLQTASSLAPHMYEPHFNFATVSDKIGDLQRSYVAAQKSEAAFPDHVDTQHLIKQLKQHFAML